MLLNNIVHAGVHATLRDLTEVLVYFGNLFGGGGGTVLLNSREINVPRHATVFRPQRVNDQPIIKTSRQCFQALQGEVSADNYQY